MFTHKCQCSQLSPFWQGCEFSQPYNHLPLPSPFNLSVHLGGVFLCKGLSTLQMQLVDAGFPYVYCIWVWAGGTSDDMRHSSMYGSAVVSQAYQRHIQVLPHFLEPIDFTYVTLALFHDSRFSYF